MIEFHCRNCGQKMSVLEMHAGRKSKCPKCKRAIVVPKTEPAGTFARRSPPTKPRTRPERAAYNLTLLDVPEVDETQAQPVGKADMAERASGQIKEFEESPTARRSESAVERELPWLVDILLYPTSKAGLLTVAVIIGVRWLLKLAVEGLGKPPGPLSPFTILYVPALLVAILIRIVLYLYLYWYFCECIRNSAGGGIRAPETAGNPPGLGALLWQPVKTAGCFIFFLGPAFLYFLHTQQTDTVFWLLVVYAGLFFPMSLIAVVMFDSFAGLNPLLLIGSIRSTLLPYGAMIVAFVSAGLLIAESLPETRWSTTTLFILQCCGFYLLLVAAHLLGSFYHHYEQQLNWDV